MSSTRLLFLMLGGDFAPRIRAALPAAIYNARRGDPAPLLRLATLSETGAEPANPRDFSTAIFTATICEEVELPVAARCPVRRPPAPDGRDDRARSASPRSRRSARAPRLQTDLIQLCRRWMEASPGPPSVSPAAARRARR